MKILKISKNFFFKIFRDYTYVKEHSSGTPNMQKFLIFDPLARLMARNVLEKRLLGSKHAQTCPGVR